jgi:hypothetical protein
MSGTEFNERLHEDKSDALSWRAFCDGARLWKLRPHLRPNLSAPKYVLICGNGTEVRVATIKEAQKVLRGGKS